MIKEIIDKKQKETIAKKVLHDLPEWFGIPEYTSEYIVKSKDMPFFAAYKDDEAIGFISLKETSKYTLEIYCMGILKKYHHYGYGKALVAKINHYALENGYEFLQVKTVEEGQYKIYDQTNQFYRSVGFYELEVFPTLWDENNPCQIFVKSVLSKKI